MKKMIDAEFDEYMFRKHLRHVRWLRQYEMWLKLGHLPGGSGVCLALRRCGNNKAAMTIFDYAFVGCSRRVRNTGSTDYWFTAPRGVFTGVRQNMVLLLAAMNGEL